MTVEQMAILIKDKKEFGKLNSYDGIIVQHIVNAMSGSDMRAERESLLNRIEGRPTQIIEQRIGALAPSLSKDYEDTKAAEMNYAEQMAAAANVTMDAATESVKEEMAQEDGNTEYYEPGESSPGDGMAS